MRFTSTPVAGVVLVESDPVQDERGFFARVFCEREFEAHGLAARMVQGNISFNTRRATLRGLHYQRAPHAEAKLVRCTAGAIFDVAVDLRRESATFRRWTAVELSAANHRMLYVPEGCAHGYLTLTEASEVAYQVSAAYAPEAAAGVRWDDPAFGIAWPGAPDVIHPRDRTYPDFDS
jgi:dTDP-4-dehydrorhamnose 3,5-epimerase